jgi:hypothetical protein
VYFCWFHILFNPDEVGDILLRNIKLFSNFTASQFEHGNEPSGVIKLEDFFD